MSRALLAAVLVIACACTQTQARKAHRGGEIATAGGLVGILAFATAASLVPAHEDTLLSVGVTFVPISVVGALVYIATDSKVNRDHGPAPTLRERHRATARELTQRAADAARMRDCTQVQAIAPRVRELDHDFHTSVFIRDAAIQRCLRQR